jgi:diguanylate cyclase (GGDEF)-like protein
VRTAPSTTATVGSVVTVLCCALAALVLPAGEFGPWVAGPVGCLAAAVAAGSLAHRARRLAGKARRGLALMATGCAAWSAGHTTTLLTGDEGAVAAGDVAGSLGFSILAAVALLRADLTGRRRDVWALASDAAVTAGAVGLVGWQASMSADIAMGRPGGGAVHAALVVAAPLSDVLLLGLAVLILVRRRGGQTRLVLVTCGLATLAASDVGHGYLQATGGPVSPWVGLGWIAAFLLLALAGTVRPAYRTVGRVAASTPQTSVLPLLGVGLATVSAVAHVLAGRALQTGEVLATASVIALLLLRQHLELRENGRLTAALADREAELRRQAFHDVLTGLPNRALLRERLDLALHRHARDGRPVALVFLDLDGFKSVNDSLGHAAGDALLMAVAARLVGAVRAGDTVARLGGDEFAVLLDDGGDPVATGARAVEVIERPVVLGGHEVTVSASVGVVLLGPEGPSPTAEDLLEHSDSAMYAAKRAGGGRLVLVHATAAATDRLAPAG